MRGRRNLTKEKAKARDMYIANHDINGRDLAKALGISAVTGYNWIKEFRGDSPIGRPSDKPLSDVTLGEFIEELYNKHVEVVNALSLEKDRRVQAETQLDSLQRLAQEARGRRTSISNLFKEFNQVLGLKTG